MRLFPVKQNVRFSTSHPSDVETVSIIIASYKYGHVVRDTLDSILAQTYPSIELVVVDDCSPDGTVQIIEDWMLKNGSKLAGCLLVQHLENQGLSIFVASATKCGSSSKSSFSKIASG
jgi:glycosyltransferase involved in cell wall biosynthesis